MKEEWDPRVRQRQAYQELVGKPPGQLPEDDPLAHQWAYRGKKAEREALEEELLAPPVIEGQGTLA